MALDKLKNAVGYCRVSTQAQGNDDRFGIEAQKAAIMKYANEHGYFIRRWYVDEISGVSENRPEWDKIIVGDDALTNPPFEAVIVFKNDRVARDTKLYFYFLMCLERKNIKLISTVEDFMEGTDFANVYRALVMFVAEQERKNIVMRTMQGKRMKASQGKWSVAKAPYGYALVNKELVVDEYYAKMVRVIIRLTDLGFTRQYVCDYITDIGYRTRKGGKFNASHIQAIIRNRPLYEGMYRFGKDMDWVVGVHSPIIDTVYDSHDPNNHSVRRSIEGYEEVYINDLTGLPEEDE